MGVNPRIIAWTVIIGLIFLVALWAKQSHEEKHGKRVRPMSYWGRDLVKYVMIGAVVVLSLNTIITGKMTPFIHNFASVHGVSLYGTNQVGTITPEVKVDFGGRIQTLPGIPRYKERAIGEFRFKPHRPHRTEQLGGNPDSLLVTIDTQDLGWNVLPFRAGPGDIIYYEFRDRFYRVLNDKEGWLNHPVNGYSKNSRGDLWWPRDVTKNPVSFFTVDAPAGAFVLKRASGQPLPMEPTSGGFRLNRDFRGKQELMIGPNLMQTEGQSKCTQGLVRLVIVLRHPNT